MLSTSHASANALIQSAREYQVTARRMKMPTGYQDPMHQHPWHQVIFPLKGMLQTQAGQVQYLLPQGAALFVPAGMQHESMALSHTSFIGIYIHPSLGGGRVAATRTFAVSVFLRELMLELVRAISECRDKLVLRHLVDVLYDGIVPQQEFRFQLLLPQDRRLKAIFDGLIRTPSLNWTLAQWGSEVGASQRTLSRLFANEFGCSFSLWRQHFRLIKSLALLEQGESVAQVGFKMGYQNDSSYIKAFKEKFGVTPGQFFSL